MAGRRLARRFLGAGALVALVVPAFLVISSVGVGAVTVSSEEQLRTAFADDTETSIVLEQDIFLDDCAEGDVSRTILGPPLPPLTLDGAGFTITQLCPNERVLQTDGDLTLLNVTITGGALDSSSGGGILLGNGGTPSLVVRGSTISGNRAGGGGSGGGIDGQTTGTILIEDSTVSGNVAGDTGGGVRTFGDSLTIVRSTISGNSANGDGGGIDTSQGGPLTLVNSTVVDNSVPGDGFGGGIIGDDVTLVYSTITSNAAANGANLALQSGDGEVFAPFGSVIAQPLGGGANCLFSGGPSTVSAGYNFSDDGSCALLGATDRQGAGDPLLGALGANGGPTLTRLPATTSPLVDAIPVGACRADGASDVTTDQRGVTRPQMGGCDIGAVEIELVLAFTG